ncbi:hypothetical protein P5663_10180 [Priestia flexa]|uniref:hypothetical protein n=1 Tax=Priestia flexa TaxID=86664 RepID=UPI0030C728FF
MITNLQRLEMETKGIKIEQNELTVHLLENNLQPHEEYIATSSTSKRNVYKAALSILEGIANNPQTMKNYTVDDTNVSYFHNNLMTRIHDLERKIRVMQDDVTRKSGSFFYLFSN